MEKKINTIVAKTATSWKKRAKEDRINRRQISRTQAFAIELMDFMDSHQIKQIDIAKKMGVTPQQVNKILTAKANLTFETLDKIAIALGVNISYPKIKTITIPSTPIIHTQMQIVHKRKYKPIEENLTTKTITKQNPILNPTMKSLSLYCYTANQI